MSLGVASRFATTISGGLCVMTPGVILMLKWLADSWDLVLMVSGNRAYYLQKKQTKG